MAVAVGEATADARAEALAIGEVLLVGVGFSATIDDSDDDQHDDADNGKADLLLFLHWRSF